MYKLSHFQEQDQSKVISFMKENPFDFITGNGIQYPVATQIPLAVEELDGTIFLRGHLMKNTDHYKAFEQNENVLVLFNGPHCYVSAGWYNDPQTASTWNYITVHARGKIRFSDETGTYKAIESVTNQYEGINGVASFNKIPQAYIDKLITAIIGFTIEIESVENVFKLSQNKTLDEQKNIIKKLMESEDYNANVIAGEMQKRLPE
jgi:transcriptional regulator